MLAEFNYEISHIAGKKHGNANGLSQLGKYPDFKQCKKIEKKDGGLTRQETEDVSWVKQISINLPEGAINLRVLQCSGSNPVTLCASW